MDMPRIDHIDTSPRYVKVLQTQASSKAENRGSLPCPYGHNGRIFQSVDQLLDHARAEHPLEVQGIDDSIGRMKVRDAVLRAM